MRRIFSVFTVLFAFSALFSCKTSPVTPPILPPIETGSSVWKVSDGNNTLFLGGSIHILREMDFPLPEEFDHAFSQSEILVLEADIEQMADENVLQHLMSQMTLPGNQTLRSILEPHIYRTLEAECNQYGFSLSMDGISTLKPTMIMTTLSMFQIQKYGFVQQGVDMYYLNRAKKENKPVYYLETVETQLDALVTMGDGYEDDYVLYSLKDMADTEQGLTTLMAEWKGGGRLYMEKTLAEMNNQFPDIYKTLMTDRNSAWMPQIAGYLASGRVYFVIVGLAHMHSPDGLLRQLEDAGYSVEKFR